MLFSDDNYFTSCKLDKNPCQSMHFSFKIFIQIFTITFFSEPQLLAEQILNWTIQIRCRIMECTVHTAHCTVHSAQCTHHSQSPKFQKIVLYKGLSWVLPARTFNCWKMGNTQIKTIQILLTVHCTYIYTLYNNKCSFCWQVTSAI